jgi:CO/xanthine dehydrogenase Mo-binding subunit
MASAAVRPGRAGPAIGVHIVDLEVDPETGKVQILRYTAVQDAGTAVHPSYVEGQIQGGVAQGVGWALTEEYVYDDQGHLLNASCWITAFHLPGLADDDTVIVEIPHPGHPYGVRGVGEVPIVPPPAAIANAIHQALGVRMSVLPMSPGRILEALWSQSEAP